MSDGPGPVIQLFTQTSKPAQKWSASPIDRAHLGSLSVESLGKLERFCDLNPTGAEDLIRFTLEVLDQGRELGYDEAIDEVATGRSDSPEVRQAKVEAILAKLQGE